MTVRTFDERICALGEGPLWHPEREQLFWFDILGKCLLSVGGNKQQQWQFDEHVSAAGWVDNNTLLVASETALYRFNIETGQKAVVVPLEAGNPHTRSNDGRADRRGGFWIGTMGLGAEPGAGAIYRYYRGELRLLYPEVTIPNAICFSPDGQFAFFTDTALRRIMRQSLDNEGWPVDSPRPHIDFNGSRQNPDGAVVDEEGFLWVALWGSNLMSRYTPQGKLDQEISVPNVQPSCPALGGKELRTLFITSATQGLADPSEWDGKTMQTFVTVAGQCEHRVVLD